MESLPIFLCFICVIVDEIFTLHRFWMQLMTNPGVLMVQHWLRLHRPLKNCTDLFVTLHTWILLETLRPLWFFTLFPFCCTSCYYLDLIFITWLMYWNMIQLRVSDGYECFMEKIYWTRKELALCLQGNTKFGSWTFIVSPLKWSFSHVPLSFSHLALFFTLFYRSLISFKRGGK